MANEQMRAFWDTQGAEWVRHHEIFDRLLAPFGGAVLAALAPVAGESVLDVGCGFGTTLAALVDAGARAVGVDISTPMIDAAHERVPEATAFVADVQTEPLEPGAPYDGVLSRFGVMFFEDPQAAFANIGAATRPGGRLAFVCWRTMAENPLFTFGLPRLVAALPEPPPPPGPDAPGPCAFGDGDRTQAILDGAGWSDVDVVPFDSPIVFGGTGATRSRTPWPTSNGTRWCGRSASSSPRRSAMRCWNGSAGTTPTGRRTGASSSPARPGSSPPAAEAPVGSAQRDREAAIVSWPSA